MDVGLGLTFQNLKDTVTDIEVFRHELALAARAEDQGFDSVWTPEHHFTGYMMTPNVPQFLSWVAGQTKRIKLGTTVTVLPWQNPVRIAESFLLLDQLSEGRAILGIGRGLGKGEFDGFGVPMGESRKRFREYAEALLNALETGVMEYEGTYLKQPRVELRPRPYASYRGRVFASAVSPESVQLMANLDVGLMIIAQKPWDRVEEDIVAYRKRFFEMQSRPAPKPVMVAFVAVNEDAAKAREMRDKYLVEYARSTSEFYQFSNKGFASIDGYEYYGALAASVEKHGIEKFNDFLADLQVYGRPEEVVEKLKQMVARFDVGSFIIYTQFGDMPFEVGRANYELFARKILPHLKDINVSGALAI
ncbi:MAG: alkane 1-monooxygenase [Hydrocarboniphaga sp.]|uniref:LLM class flavin-dependent oxidoreductase n=1 Tax=Hydrocarboniphaga sp. TaxID=2033016 RepID=UPI00260E7DE9|nr:LLM class flavin-dependent oxidoreductase [Hydrocarboniphaga sp.]MDB5972818.1 alkane 1-monooxygenase [Hydrocarboniphaga sp.]